MDSQTPDREVSSNTPRSNKTTRTTRTLKIRNSLRSAIASKSPIESSTIRMTGNEGMNK
jgi:hypothetical protein